MPPILKIALVGKSHAVHTLQRHGARGESELRLRDLMQMERPDNASRRQVRACGSNRRRKDEMTTATRKSVEPLTATEVHKVAAAVECNCLVRAEPPQKMLLKEIVFKDR